jgi:anti-anti-sigma regulatory factor
MVGRRDGDAMYADKQLVIKHTIPPNMLIFSGVIDFFNVDSVAEALASQMDGDGDLHLELREVEFGDVSGVRALVSAAESVSGARRLVLHGLPPLLRRAMTVVGWGELPNLVLCECGGDEKSRPGTIRARACLLMRP